jgi:hypothetical protein
MAGAWTEMRGAWMQIRRARMQTRAAWTFFSAALKSPAAAAESMGTLERPACGRAVRWAEPLINLGISAFAIYHLRFAISPKGLTVSAFPTSPRGAFLLWCQEHAPVWTTNALDIGMTAAQATAFSGAVTAANASNIAVEAARQAYRTAVDTNNDNFAALRSLAGDDVRTIRAFAENAEKPGAIYALAQIPPPADPQPAPPPGMPTDLSVSIEPATGNLELKWKSTNPAGTSGTSYIVRRKLPGETAFSFIGVTGSKKFVDATFFAGPDSVQYTVQGQRADSSGPMSEVFTINFGRAGGGGFQISNVAGGGQGGTVGLAA